jgi:hypothetical protein
MVKNWLPSCIRSTHICLALLTWRAACCCTYVWAGVIHEAALLVSVSKKTYGLVGAFLVLFTRHRFAAFWQKNQTLWRHITASFNIQRSFHDLHIELWVYVPHVSFHFTYLICSHIQPSRVTDVASTSFSEPRLILFGGGGDIIKMPLIKVFLVMPANCQNSWVKDPLEYRL